VIREAKNNIIVDILASSDNKIKPPWNIIKNETVKVPYVLQSRCPPYL
jgi:hypothetical protein